MKTLRILAAMAVTILLTLTCSCESPEKDRTIRNLQNMNSDKLSELAVCLEKLKVFDPETKLTSLDDGTFQNYLKEVDALKAHYDAERKAREIFKIGECTEPIPYVDPMDEKQIPESFENEPEFLPQIFEFQTTLCMPMGCEYANGISETTLRFYGNRERKAYLPNMDVLMMDDFKGDECLAKRRMSWGAIVSENHIATTDEWIPAATKDQSLTEAAYDILTNHTYWTGWYSTLKREIFGIYNNPVLATQTFAWALPKKVATFSGMTLSHQEIVLKTLKMWRKYLGGYNHEKERAYLVELSKDDCDPSKYTYPEFMEQSHDCLSAFQRLNSDGKFNPVRRLVAWSYRRIEAGHMPLSTQVKFLDMGIAALEKAKKSAK